MLWKTTSSRVLWSSWASVSVRLVIPALLEDLGLRPNFPATVLPAVAACLCSMQLGERCELVVSPQHGYGDKGTDRIPPDSQLRFVIFLRDIRGCDVTEERDGAVRKSVLRPSSKKSRPTNGTQVQSKCGRLERRFVSDRKFLCSVRLVISNWLTC